MFFLFLAYSFQNFGLGYENTQQTNESQIEHVLCSYTFPYLTKSVYKTLDLDFENTSFNCQDSKEFQKVAIE